MVLDGEDDEPAGVLPQQRLLLLHAPRHLEWREKSSGWARGGAGLGRETEGHSSGETPEREKGWEDRKTPPRERGWAEQTDPSQGRKAWEGGETPEREKGWENRKISPRERGWAGRGDRPHRVRRAREGGET